MRAEFQALCNERDQYRNEINKSTYHEKTKNGKILYKLCNTPFHSLTTTTEMIEQQAVELQKLNAIIVGTEHEMRVLKKKYLYFYKL